jgi:hypothetical protein
MSPAPQPVLWTPARAQVPELLLVHHLDPVPRRGRGRQPGLPHDHVQHRAQRPPASVPAQGREPEPASEPVLAPASEQAPAQAPAAAPRPGCSAASRVLRQSRRQFCSERVSRVLPAEARGSTAGDVRLPCPFPMQGKGSSLAIGLAETDRISHRYQVAQVLVGGTPVCSSRCISVQWRAGGQQHGRAASGCQLPPLPGAAECGRGVSVRRASAARTSSATAPHEPRGAC